MNSVGIAVGRSEGEDANSSAVEEVTEKGRECVAILKGESV